MQECSTQSGRIIIKPGIKQFESFIGTSTNRMEIHGTGMLSRARSAIVRPHRQRQNQMAARLIIFYTKVCSIPINKQRENKQVKKKQ
jgi:hypothetical protein